VKKLKEPPAKPGRPARHKGARLSKNRTFRVRPELDSVLAQAAQQSGRSVSEEIERRLDLSFKSEDVFTAALGGPELRDHALILIASFAAGGRSDSNGRPPQEWLRDKDSYRQAFVGAAMAMINAMPSPTIDEKVLLLEALKMRIAAGLTQTGELKFDFGDGRGPVGSGFIPPKKDDAS
jgi:hypothetical protein